MDLKVRPIFFSAEGEHIFLQYLSQLMMGTAIPHTPHKPLASDSAEQISVFCIDDVYKFRLERGATNKEAIHIMLGSQFLAIGRSD